MILGASIAGLLAARVMTDHAASVVVVEQDKLPDTPQHRPGVPQSRHTHGLFEAGLRAVERLLPGIGAQLHAVGAVELDASTELALCTPFGWSTSVPSGLRVLGAARPVLEWALRRRVLALPGVRLLDQHRAENLRADATTITGVHLRDLTADRTFTLDADLVVDATGRGTHTARWLASLGWPQPGHDVVHPHLAYASRFYHLPEDFPLRSVYLMPLAPWTKGGILAPIGGDRWIVSLAGFGTDQPARTEAGFLAFARSLPRPDLADILTLGTPLSGVTHSRASRNRRYHLGRLSRQPGNLLWIGDSACCFNPIYAQGMTVAALSAELLDDVLTRAGTPDQIARPYHRRLARLHDPFWTLATTADTRHPACDAAPTITQRAMGWYLDRVLSAATHDIRVHEAFLAVQTMVRPPHSLVALPTMLRAAAHGRGSHPRLSRASTGRSRLP